VAIMRRQERGKGLVVERGRYLGVDELPARPDPSTGLPRPPHAPAYVRGADPGQRDPADAPSPPPGQGPVLAWYQANCRYPLTVAAWTLGLSVGIITLANGFVWTKYWWAWGIFGLGTFASYRSSWSGACAVGAHWLARGRKWVKIYELVEVTYRMPIGGARLRLRDSEGRRLTVKVKALRSDRVIWDSLYNGILHSVIAGGARTNSKLHLDMHVPHPRPDAED
jgi:hypothetical protein